MPIAALALFLALPLWAQHGGGHIGGGFGGRTGFSGAHSFGGVHSAPSVSRSFTRLPSSRAGFSRGPYLHNGFRNGFGNGFRDRRFRTYGFRNNCYGYGCWGYGYGYPWWGYYDPWLSDWWDSDSSYDNDYYNNLAAANQMNEDNLEQQRMFRQEEADGDQDAYARPAPAPRPAQEEKQGTSIIPDTVLVFRDQHKEEIQNYAIVGNTLWNFAAQHTQKIPLADLDLAATTKANDDRGVIFRLPIASEAQ